MSLTPGQTNPGNPHTGSFPCGHRDCFHVAGIVASMPAGKPKPGMSVKFDETGLYVTESQEHNRDGIIDPFIKGKITTYDNFTVFIEPSKMENVIHYFDVKGVTRIDSKFVAQESEDEYSDDSDGCGGCN